MSFLPPASVEYPGPFTHEYLHTRGIRLHAAVRQPVIAGSSKQLVLLVHDAPGFWADWLPLLPHLAPTATVAALDLRGVGASDKPPGANAFDIRTVSGDLAGSIHALGFEQAVLVGAGVGGTLAWTVAAHQPERVAAVVSFAGLHPGVPDKSVASSGGVFNRTLASWRGFLLERDPAELAAQSVAAVVPAARLTTPIVQEIIAQRTVNFQIKNTVSSAKRLAKLAGGFCPVKLAGAEVFAPVGLFAPCSAGTPEAERWLQLAQKRAEQVTLLPALAAAAAPYWLDPEQVAAHINSFLAPL